MLRPSVMPAITNQRARLLGAFLALAVIALLAAGVVLWWSAQPRVRVITAVPATDERALPFDPQRFAAPAATPMTPDAMAAAIALNAAVPFVPEARQTASPFLMPVDVPATDRVSAEHCLALAVYYEAASESLTGQRAVAQVVLNRVRHPLYPRTVCGVVFQGAQRATGCQFTFTCDGAMLRPPSVSGWRRALMVAQAALNGFVEPAVGTATHYHTDWVAPAWRTELVKIAQIGTHLFYRWPARTGAPATFAMRYRGGEDSAYATVMPGDATPGLVMVPATAVLPVDPAPPPSPIIADHVAGSMRPTSVGDGGRARLRADEDHGKLIAAEPSGTLTPQY